MSEIMLKTIIMLAILFVGYVILFMLYSHDCKKMGRWRGGRKHE